MRMAKTQPVGTVPAKTERKLMGHEVIISLKILIAFKDLLKGILF